MKRLITIALAIVLTLTLAACGNVQKLRDADKSVKAGDAIRLGEIDWLVLTVVEDKALLMSEKVLEERVFDASSNIWENSDIRAYLNGSFYDSTFSEQEKKQIADKTGEKVFLLSADEVNDYMGDDAVLTIRSAVVARHIDTDDIYWWWLRSPGNIENTAAAVIRDGRVAMYGYDVHNAAGGLRPALWLNL